MKLITILALLSVNLPAQIPVILHSQPAICDSVYTVGWRTFGSLSDPIPWSCSWSNFIWPATTGIYEPAAVAISLRHFPAQAPQASCIGEVPADLVLFPVLSPWPGVGEITYTPGNGVWYLRFDPPPILLGITLYIQLYTNNGVSETLEVYFNP